MSSMAGKAGSASRSVSRSRATVTTCRRPGHRHRPGEGRSSSSRTAPVQAGASVEVTTQRSWLRLSARDADARPALVRQSTRSGRLRAGRGRRASHVRASPSTASSLRSLPHQTRSHREGSSQPSRTPSASATSSRCWAGVRRATSRASCPKLGFINDRCAHEAVPVHDACRLWNVEPILDQSSCRLEPGMAPRWGFHQVFIGVPVVSSCLVHGPWSRPPD